jgi:oxygen-independent coproporphyrinogen-3 oxidase
MSRGRAEVERYVAAVIDEIAMEPEWGPLHAVNLGGGTPSTLSPGQVAELIEALRRRFGLVPGAEISIEANPEDWSPEYAAALAGCGVNRVSLGVQSFDPDVLVYLGRLHKPEEAIGAVRAARNAGITSINIDLIFGAPIETLESWRFSVSAALDAGPDHVSAYALTVELGTALSRQVQSGAAAPDDDDQADKYELFDAAATLAGLEHYEVSNWARPGHTCRYNSTTWAHGEYIAFGTGAHGFRNGIRSRNVRRLDRYLDLVEEGRRPVAGTEELTGFESDRERVFVGLRRIGGVQLGAAGRRFLESAAGIRMVEAGVVRSEGDRLAVD